MEPNNNYFAIREIALSDDSRVFDVAGHEATLFAGRSFACIDEEHAEALLEQLARCADIT